MVISSVNKYNAGDTSLNETDMKPILQTIRVEEQEKKLVEKNQERTGVSYESTISDSMSAGLKFIQGMEKLKDLLFEYNGGTDLSMLDSLNFLH